MGAAESAGAPCNQAVSASSPAALAGEATTLSLSQTCPASNKLARPACKSVQVGRLLRHWPLLPVLALALTLRLVDLFPAFYYGDEAEYVLVARGLAHDPGDLAYPRIEGFASTPFVSQPPLVLYLFALAIRLFGAAHGPLLMSVLLGTATVGVTYAMGVRLRDRWFGAIAAFLLAVLPYHVGVSRSAQLDAGLTFFVALAALCFLLWLERPTWARAFVAGCALAAAALAKLPGVLLMAAILLALGGSALQASWRLRATHDPVHRERLRDLGANLGVAALPALFAATLYVAFLWSLGATSDLMAKLGWQAGRVGGHVVTQATDRPWHWYFTVHEVGLLGQLGIVVALLCVIGAVAILRGASGPAQRQQRLFLVLWPSTFLLFFMASGRKEWFDLMPAMPAVVLLAAWPLQPAARAVTAFAADGKALRQGVVMAWLAAFVLVAAAAPVHATWTERIQRQGRFGDGVPEAARWIGANDPGAGQVGTTLARFALHLYNGGDTYHYYVNHTFIDQRISAGDVRYVVIDTDLNLTFEQQWLYGLVGDHDGQLVRSIPTPGGDPVKVYRLRAE